jgi:hypothetical protein
VDPNALIQTAMAVLTKPAEFFKTVKDEKGFNKGLVFSVAMALVYAILSSLYSIFHGFVVTAIIGIIIVTLIAGLVGPFIGAFIIWDICMAFGSKATWERAFPISAYSMAVAPVAGLVSLLAFVTIGLASLVGLLVWLYGLYICYVGARALMFEPTPEAKPSA